MACVVLKADERGSLIELYAFSQQELGKYKTPNIIKLVNSLPKSPAGKVRRLKLLEFRAGDGARTFSANTCAREKLARRAESLLECAAMSAAMKKLALVLLIAVLPVQALAAIVVPLCQQGVPTSVVVVADHTHHDGDHHDHDAPAPGHEHPFTAGDLGSDHCGAGCAFAIPMMSAGLAPAATAERSWFAAAYRSGFIPEQPQRPPLA